MTVKYVNYINPWITDTKDSPHKNDGRLTRVRVIVIHCTANSVSGDAQAGLKRSNLAKKNASYFANPSSKVSAHIVVDEAETWSCVAETDTAWAAPGCNADGLQLEICAPGTPTAAFWATPYGQAALARAARVAAFWTLRYGIPVTKLSVKELLAGKRGFVGHADVSAVYRKSDHTDPGEQFPWNQFLTQIQTLLNGGLVADPVQPATSATPLVLKIGSSGMAVREWQTWVLARSTTWTSTPSQKLIVDANFGNVTELWTKEFQKRNNLTVDGIRGPLTYEKAKSKGYEGN